MCDKELLVGYLYDDMEPAERRAFEAHLMTCGECRGELKGLKTARTQLRTWAPPEPALEFQVVRGQGGRRGWLRSPAWGLAAAAVLVLALASAIANVEVKYGVDGVVVRTGWTKAVAAAPAPTATVAMTQTEDLRPTLRAIGERLGALESAASARPAMVPVQASVPHPSSSEILRAVRQMLAESEGRQEQELALRITQVLRDIEGMRRVDFERMQRGLAQVQGIQDTTIIRQREMENHIFRVGQQK